MFETIDFSKLWDLLLYHKEAPILFSTGLFFFLFIAFLSIYILVHKQQRLRILYIILFSLYFYYKSSGIWFFLLLVTATSDFIIGKFIVQQTQKKKKKLLVILSLCINLGMLSYFKYFNFIANGLTQLVTNFGHFFNNEINTQIDYTNQAIFLPVGISFFTFQSLSYIIDIYRERIQPLKKWRNYLFYVSFFPQLVAGPIIRARDFIPQIYKIPILTKEMMGKGLFLILCGLFKKTIISDYISLNFVDRIFDNPLQYSGLENLFGVYGYTLQIYCDFSGYSDMAIGIALLLGFHFNINFDSPYQSATITEFWRRWHISLSSWLKDYLYISLGGNKKGKLRQYLNLMITMLLGGLWHGAAFRFILWGAWHGLALALHKLVMNLFPSFKATGQEMTFFRRVIGTFLTFHLVCFGWIFFRAASFQIGVNVLQQIIYDFHPEIFTQFINSYRLVLSLICLGYLLHFIPTKIDQYSCRLITKAPLLIQAIIFTLLIFIIIQMKSSTIQPFIYFQF